MIPYADVGLDLGGFVRRKDLVRVIPLFQLGKGTIERPQTTGHRSGPVERSPGPDSTLRPQLFFQSVVRLDTQTAEAVVMLGPL